MLFLFVEKSILYFNFMQRFREVGVSHQAFSWFVELSLKYTNLTEKQNKYPIFWDVVQV